MGIYRTLYENGDEPPQRPDPDEARLLALWLDDCQNEYDVLVARLRFLDDVLVKHKRKRRYLLPRKIDR